MSNIPDITSLSDLLTTSPNQPSSSGSKEHLGEKNTGLRLDLATKINEESRPDTGEESRTNNSMEEMEVLLKQQSVKLALVGERNELLKERANLRSSVDDLRVKMKYLQDLKQKQSTQKKREDLLTENARGIVTKTAIPSLQNDNDDDEILESLNVLPSSNWNHRLDLIKKFYPYIDVLKIASSNYYDEDGRLVRTIEFVLVSPLLFRIPFKLLIDARTEAIFDIQLPEKKNHLTNHFKKSKTILQSLTTLTMLSHSFSQVFIKDYLPACKINLAMYGLSSLSKILHKRISVIYKLVRKYASHIKDDQRLNPLLQKDELTDNVKLFSILKLLDNVTLTMKKGDDIFTLSLHWDIVLNDPVTGECESQLSLGVFQQDGKQVFPSINELFIKLIKEYGVVIGITFLIEKTFDLQI
ncbi:uncharacterized protein CANTADRAFT_7743 [Suhomyces tanzawaensis NRRL Y-17324]|uniref:Uncharacterized protein n=1 Tax=Suhomyces tanzawaensis NRRL Y-17324 TaxID=984487 RepID=A0A1E4SCR2_9ASCO|nr:uncharacterized protein CANTADRAFT_7743 [Suhomyces tanzawaensis NRRL Y-17324]ODV77256.1 hypothetical protein CANTADRAFT_7743 [Suhomyces tanzawaensis NRRL Y-17324]